MKIIISGSILFYDEMLKTKEKLEKLGHEVELPPTETKDEKGEPISIKEFHTLRKNEKDPKSWIWNKKEELIQEHFNKIKWSDANLVINHEKKGAKNYIGANTLIDMGISFFLNKKIQMVIESK